MTKSKDNNKHVVILHGTDGNSRENWFPWLGRALKQRGWEVDIPDLPGADRPNPKRYIPFLLSRYTFDADTVLIGHSSGAVAILALLAALPSSVTVDHAVLVAGFTDPLGWDTLSDLFRVPYDWDGIRKRARRFTLLHSDTDPYVPLWHGEKLRDKLGAELIILRGQGHFSVSTNPSYTTFPELLAILS